LLPKVDLKIKEIVFEHRVVSKQTDKFNSNLLEEQKEFSYFLRILKACFKSITNGLRHKMEKFKHLKIFNKHNYEFEITKLDTKHNSVSCMNVSVVNKMKKSKTTGETEVCFNLGGNSWFGGHESLGQPYWPINTQVFSYVAYVTGFPDDWGAVLDRYWLSSNGLAIFIDDSVPLFVSHSDPNKICLKSSNSSAPYKYTPVYSNAFEYKICSGPDILTTHRYMISNYLGRPLDKPDLVMLKYPVFTTWNYFFRHINQSVVLDYAKQISDHNYTISQLEIDDLWEHKYGDLDFDRDKFPNPSEMVNQMHKMNMRVTLWVHPFCNIDSTNFPSSSIYSEGNRFLFQIISSIRRYCI
jgi:alpha-glucosidase (family GH31 glycosyl hydrolase)